MTIAFALAVYFVVWWVTLFAVLPFHGRSQAESGEIVPGTPSGAPAEWRPIRIVLVNTCIASLVFAVIMAAMYYDVLGITAMSTRGEGALPSR